MAAFRDALISRSPVLEAAGSAATWGNLAFPGLTVKNTFFTFASVDSDRPLAACARNASAPPRLSCPRPPQLGLPQGREGGEVSLTLERTSGHCDSQGPAPKLKRKHRGAKRCLNPVPACLPSRGSRNHFNGVCKPCREIQTTGVCSCGYMCNFCHYDHSNNSPKDLRGTSSTSTLASLRDQSSSPSLSEQSS